MSSLLNPKKILIDTNVWIRYFLGEEPWCQDIKLLLEECNSNDIEVYYCPTSLKDIFYLIPRIMKREASGEVSAGTSVSTSGIDTYYAPLPGEASYAAAAWACIRAMQDMATAAPLTGVECEFSWMLRGNHPDLEDDLIVACGETCGADYVVTYDDGLIKHFPAACVMPKDLLALRHANL